MAEKCIELKGITKAFDGQIVLDHMNLDIHENEISFTDIKYQYLNTKTCR